ncbi:hypothetical protein ABT263_37815 [Kitasatospora sp. NPDC001603]|uniref:hypothetical protein n=1 Tax=Kitasatospora sp. NPDC001603 TaxID=3154388 RepID=UPI0033166996
METPRTWSEVKTPAQALAAEFDRRAREAAAQAAMYERLRDTAAELPRLAALWNDLVANPPHLALTLPTADAPAPAARPVPEPARPAVPAPLDTALVIALMGQAPGRLWSAEDVRTAVNAPSRKEVRKGLRELARQGLLEEVVRKARHVLFRIPQPRTATT